MSSTPSLQHLLSLARDKETTYHWLESIPFYTEALTSVVTQNEYRTAGELSERIGFCYHKAAMQAETREEFTKRIEEAIRAYNTAHGLYDKMESEQKVGRMLRCYALVKYLRHWLMTAPTRKRELLKECWHLTREALNAFEESGNCLDYCETFLQLSSTAFQICELQGDSQTSEKILREAIEFGERTITLLSTGNDPPPITLTRVYAKTAAFMGVILHYFLPNIEEYEPYYKKARSYWDNAYRVAPDVALLEPLTIPHDFDHLFSTDEILVYYTEGLDYARATCDKYLIGMALDILAAQSAWSLGAIEDPDERQKLIQHALHYSKLAKEHFNSISITSPRGGLLWAEAPYCDIYEYVAQYETDLKKKRALLTKALLDGTHGLELAQQIGLLYIIEGLHHTLSKVLLALARIAPRREKEELLKKALENRKESLRLHAQRVTSDYWNQGVGLNYLADLKAELADLETTPQNKINLLTEAVSEKERGVQLCIKEILSVEKVRDSSTYYAWLGRYRHSQGELIQRLYRLTDNPNLQRRAVQAFNEAAQTFLKCDGFSRAAECYWNMGRLHDDLREYLVAAENFSLASTHYIHASERVPHLGEFYQIHATYMDAWSEIEQAKYNHYRRQYDDAQQHFAIAATLHQSTKSWSYLSSNYLAWARLEEAESLSRSDYCKDAKNCFQEAAKLFLDTKRTIKGKVDSLEDNSEKELAHNLIKASTIRHKYCLGRIALEEARLLDRQGGHLESSTKYGVASSTFQEVADSLEQERDRQEITPIIELSKAWQIMTQAEAESSPELYSQASQLFERTEEHTTDERAKELIIGHSIFCKALESGTQFEKTQNQENYSKAKKYLIAAENYYVKAGFQNASEYARATHRLLDAYWYLYKAETELEPHKKTQYYQLSAKLLQTSSDSYSRAKYTEKTEQVQRLLGKVLDEQKLTIALTEVLHTPLNTLSTESFATPAQSFETAVGFERFEHANIQGKLTVPEYTTLGNEFDVRLDLVNVGKSRGLLVRVDNLIPPEFKLILGPSRYAVENGTIDIKGWSLQSLQVESITLRLKSMTPGSFKLNPRVLYIDELGAFQSCMPDPVTITVQPRSGFKFQTPNAERIFDFLIRSFIEDCMRRRIAVDKSGWRTLMETVKGAGISKSSIYGTKGRRGRARSELEQRGLVETRVYPGERGRGGRILKIRIAYNKDPIKRYIDQQIRKK